MTILRSPIEGGVKCHRGHRSRTYPNHSRTSYSKRDRTPKALTLANSGRHGVTLLGASTKLLYVELG